MNRRSRPLMALIAGALVVVAMLAVACGGSSNGDDAETADDITSAASSGAAGGEAAVRAIEGAGDPREAWAFDPPEITIAVGDAIEFTNDGAEVHTATADDGSFDTGTLSAGDSMSVTFETTGTFAYHCSLHPWMTGQVVVTDG